MVNGEDRVWCRYLDLQVALQGWVLDENPERQEAMNCQPLGPQRAQRPGPWASEWHWERESRSQRLGRNSETWTQMGVRGWMKAQGFLCWNYCAMNKWVYERKHLRLLRERCSDCVRRELSHCCKGALVTVSWKGSFLKSWNDWSYYKESHNITINNFFFGLTQSFIIDC